MTLLYRTHLPDAFLAPTHDQHDLSRPPPSYIAVYAFNALLKENVLLSHLTHPLRAKVMKQVTT